MPDEQDDGSTQKEIDEEQRQRTEREKENLLAHVSSSEVSTMRSRVAWLMNRFPTTRNSDITLQIKYWQTFDANIYHGAHIDVEDLYRLTRLTSISRERARIQNQYRLFLADKAIQVRRGTLEEEEREKAAKMQDYPVYAVYLDESGKTSPHLIVGSLWFLSSGTEGIDLYRDAKELKERKKFNGEFHFAYMKKSELEIYKDLVDIFLTRGGTISFKFISVPRRGIGNIQVALENLYYHLLTKGVDHENSSRRAPLPRILQGWKDSEEIGSDKLLMGNLTDRMRQVAATLYEHKLVILDKFEAIDSKSSVFLQVADLMASSVNRILSGPSEVRTHKDELAEYLVGRLGISLTPGLEVRIGDIAAHISL